MTISTKQRGQLTVALKKLSPSKALVELQRTKAVAKALAAAMEQEGVSATVDDELIERALTLNAAPQSQALGHHHPLTIMVTTHDGQEIEFEIRDLNRVDSYYIQLECQVIELLGVLDSGAGFDLKQARTFAKMLVEHWSAEGAPEYLAALNILRVNCGEKCLPDLLPRRTTSADLGEMIEIKPLLAQLRETVILVSVYPQFLEQLDEEQNNFLHIVAQLPATRSEQLLQVLTQLLPLVDKDWWATPNAAGELPLNVLLKHQTELAAGCLFSAYLENTVKAGVKLDDIDPEIIFKLADGAYLSRVGTNWRYSLLPQVMHYLKQFPDYDPNVLMNGISAMAVAIAAHAYPNVLALLKSGARPMEDSVNPNGFLPTLIAQHEMLKRNKQEKSTELKRLVKEGIDKAPGLKIDPAKEAMRVRLEQQLADLEDRIKVLETSSTGKPAASDKIAHKAAISFVIGVEDAPDQEQAALKKKKLLGLLCKEKLRIVKKIESLRLTAHRKVKVPKRADLRLLRTHKKTEADFLLEASAMKHDDPLIQALLRVEADLEESKRELKDSTKTIRQVLLHGSMTPVKNTDSYEAKRSWCKQLRALVPKRRRKEAGKGSPQVQKKAKKETVRGPSPS